MKIDNILLDYNDEGTTLNAMIADFGRARLSTEYATIPYGRRYGPPESYIAPYDGEKADVFATAFILLALLKRTWFGAID